MEITKMENGTIVVTMNKAEQYDYAKAMRSRIQYSVRCLSEKQYSKFDKADKTHKCMMLNKNDDFKWMCKSDLIGKLNDGVSPVFVRFRNNENDEYAEISFIRYFMLMLFKNVEDAWTTAIDDRNIVSTVECDE